MSNQRKTAISAVNAKKSGSISINIILLIALELFIIFISNSKLAGEDDLFWYLSTGRYIVESSSIPSSDVFGFTTSGVPWIPFEWGWDIIIYYIHSAGGYLGLHILSTCLILIIINLIIYNLIKLKTNYTLISIAVVLLLLGIALRFSVKPHLISYMFIALLLTIIIRYRYINRGSYKILFYIPLIFLVWINMHMGVLAGLFLLGLYFLSELTGTVFSNRLKSQTVKALSKNELIRLGLVIFLSAAATLMNPHGIKTYLHAFHIISMKQLDIIYEWVSPFSEIYMFSFSNFIYYIFIIGLIPVFLYSVRNKDFTPLMLTTGFFVYSLSAARLMVDFMLVSVIFTTVSVNYIISIDKNEKLAAADNINKYVMACVIILLTVMIPGNHLYKITEHPRSFGYGIDENNFPVKMFDFMKRTNMTGIGEKPFNSYETGGFFAWNFPNKKGFIGSRTISDEVWNNYTSILNSQPGFENIIERTGFDYVMWSVPFLNYAQNPSLLDYGILSYLFRNNDKWKLVYWDDTSFLFVKNESKFNTIIKENEYIYISPYNAYFNKAHLGIGIENEKEVIDKEMSRKLKEDSEGRFTKHFLNNIKYPLVK
jgi:hypothetical protein